MGNNKCYFCNILDCKDNDLFNGQTVFVCSESCKNNVRSMDLVLNTIRDISKNYGSSISIDEFPYILDGFIGRLKTKNYIHELIARKFLVKKNRFDIELIK